MGPELGRANARNCLNTIAATLGVMESELEFFFRVEIELQVDGLPIRDPIVSADSGT